MFSKEDFEVPLESKLRERVIFDEIDQCSDVEALRKNLKHVTNLFMRYQHLLNAVLAKQLEKNIEDFLREAKIDATEIQS